MLNRDWVWEGENYSNHTSRKRRLKREYLKPAQAAKGVTTTPDYGASLFIPMAILAQSNSSVRCLYTRAHRMGNKREELEVCVQSQGFDLTAIMKMQSDSSHGMGLLECCHAGPCLGETDQEDAVVELPSM